MIGDGTCMACSVGQRSVPAPPIRSGLSSNQGRDSPVSPTALTRRALNSLSLVDFTLFDYIVSSRALL